VVISRKFCLTQGGLNGIKSDGNCIYGISENLEKMGVNVDYVGSLISGYLEEGYIPMVF